MRQWPCEIPYSDSSISHLCFLDIPQLMKEAKSRFQSWYHNNTLRDHLKQVQAVLDEFYLGDSQPGGPPYAFIPCLAKSPSTFAFIPFEDLLQRDAPELKQPPAILGTDSLSLHGGLQDAAFQANSHLHGNNQAATRLPPTTVVSGLFREFQCNDANAFHQLYGNDLTKSQQALCGQAPEVIPDCIPISSDVLLEYRDQCRTHLQKSFESIRQSLLPTNPVDSAMFTAGLWPRLTIRSLLAKLTYSSYNRLSSPW